MNLMFVLKTRMVDLNSASPSGLVLPAASPLGIIQWNPEKYNLI